MKCSNCKKTCSRHKLEDAIKCLELLSVTIYKTEKQVKKILSKTKQTSKKIDKLEKLMKNDDNSKLPKK